MTTSVFVLSATQSWEFFARRKDHYKKILCKPLQEMNSGCVNNEEGIVGVSTMREE